MRGGKEREIVLFDDATFAGPRGRGGKGGGEEEEDGETRGGHTLADRRSGG